MMGKRPNKTIKKGPRESQVKKKKKWDDTMS